jgi:TPR repeat protein
MAVVNIVQPAVVIADGRNVDVKGAVAKNEERAAKGDSFAAATLGDLAKVSEAQARMSQTEEPAVPPEALLASAAPGDVAAPKPPVATSPPLANATAEPAKPEIAAPAARAVPAASASSPLPQDEATALLKRGRDLIAVGDIASARLMLTLVADAGNAEAAFIMAGTFDPAELARLHAIGVQGDPAKARAWYARAAELGSAEARQHLQALR